MKICYGYSRSNTKALRHVKKGELVEFQGRFHQDCRDDDVFIVTDDSSYRTELIDEYGGQRESERRYAVVNLRTGKLSYVLGTRHVFHRRAEVQVGEVIR